MLITRDLAARVEAATVAQQVGTSVALAAREPDGPARHRLLAGGALVYGGPGMYVNRGVGLGLQRAIMPRDLEEIEAFYDAVGAPAELELCPFAIRLDAVLDATAVRAWGLRALRPSFVLDIGALDTGALDTGAHGEPVARAGARPLFRTVDDASLPVWQEVVATGFSQTDLAAREVSDRFCAAAHDAPGAVDLIVEVDGQPAGACSVTIADGVALLGGMAVVPGHRGRGLQRAALAHRLRLAGDAGCDLAAVGALYGGTSFGNVLRAGFTMAWTNVVLRRPTGTGQKRPGVRVRR